MKKIKLSEGQIKMLQSLKSNRVLKINKKQLNMVLESVNILENQSLISDIQLLKNPSGKYFLGRTKYNEKLNQEFPYSRDSGFYDSPKDACIKYKRGEYNKVIQETESILDVNTVQILGNPCEYVKSLNNENSVPGSTKISSNYRKFTKGLSGLSLEGNVNDFKVSDKKYTPQTIKQNIKTNKSFNKYSMNEDNDIDLFSFANEIIKFLKEILINPQTSGRSTMWNKLGISRNGMVKKMSDVGLLTIINEDGNNTIKVIRNNIKSKIKKLYIELTDSKKITEEEGDYPLGGKYDKAAPYNQEDSYNQRKVINKGFNLLYYNGDFSIFKYGDNLIYFEHSAIDKSVFYEYSNSYNSDDEDNVYNDFDIDDASIEGFVNDNISKLSKGSGIDGDQNGDDLVLIDEEFKNLILSNYKSDKLFNILSVIGETTSCGSSSGSFVAPLSDPIKGRFEESNHGDDIELDETTVAGYSGEGGSSGPYVTPRVWAKSKKDHITNKAWWPNGKVVGNKTEDDIEGISENAHTDTQYPMGQFVKFDDCTKLNNTDTSTGCSQGAVDNVVKTKTSKKSVVSSDAIYYEVAKKTGKSIDEVKKILKK